MAAMASEILRRSLAESVKISNGSGSGELHVLAVDDSLVDRKVIERLLKISSCKVTAVESGTRALQYLGLDGEKSSVGFDYMAKCSPKYKENRLLLHQFQQANGISDLPFCFSFALKVNLIMTDYSMPGMTGYELLKKIKRLGKILSFWLYIAVRDESSAFREVPVVIMSSENIMTRIDSSPVLSSQSSSPPLSPKSSLDSCNQPTDEQLSSSPSSPECSPKRPRLQSTDSLYEKIWLIRALFNKGILES
ncbi:hypothetical protein F8388_012254 [Cannabis sativa]|uniref:Response regulatory domain-containing protein n=1 Tax=Cannabis sativa TaxID=3483 RepID=A0A7J6E2E4_CANSA|nr:hypothetical protein F8388_012254 [Cannabis sativa]